MAVYTTKDTGCYIDGAFESREIESLKAHPDRVVLYVGSQTMPDIGLRDMPCITTWLGTIVSQWCKMGPRVYVGWNGAYRRYINCRIFGVRYVGWYMESSGNYCRLRKAKVQ